jgi:hypothetical protein
MAKRRTSAAEAVPLSKTDFFSTLSEAPFIGDHLRDPRLKPWGTQKQKHEDQYFSAGRRRPAFSAVKTGIFRSEDDLASEKGVERQ